jgi:hypothetical protein
VKKVEKAIEEAIDGKLGGVFQASWIPNQGKMPKRRRSCGGSSLDNSQVSE